MRSRDGNRYFSFRFYSVILCASLALNASEYLISYSYTVKDATLYNESLLISKAMKKCAGNPHDNFSIESNGEKNLKKIISSNFEEFINYIHKLGLHIRHKEKTINSQNISSTTLTLKTTCFKVDINDNFARIAPLK